MTKIKIILVYCCELLETLLRDHFVEPEPHLESHSKSVVDKTTRFCRPLLADSSHGYTRSLCDATCCCQPHLINMAASLGPLGRIVRLSSSLCRKPRLVFNRGAHRRCIASCIDRKSLELDTQPPSEKVTKDEGRHIVFP